MRSNEKITYFYVYVYVYLLIIKKKKVQKTWACQTWVQYYKELEFGKLEYHRRKRKEYYAWVLYLQRTQVW